MTAKSTNKVSLPNHSFEALEALRPFITEKAKQLAAERLRMTDEKVTLLIVKEINPYEILTNQEEALIRGISRDKLRGHKTRKELPPVL